MDEDPDTWFAHLNSICLFLADIGDQADYCKKDYEVKAHLLNQLPYDIYRNIISQLQKDIIKPSLDEMQRMI